MSRAYRRYRNRKLKKGLFIKTANKTKKANVSARVYRGGVRL